MRINLRRVLSFVSTVLSVALSFCVVPARVRRLLSSAPLPCGCLAGLYEARNGSIVTLIDARGPGCDEQSHRLDARLEPCLSVGVTGATSAPLARFFGRGW